MLGKERDSAFCCPKIACRNCVVHGSIPALLGKIELLQLVWKIFGLVLDAGQKTLFFFHHLCHDDVGIYIYSHVLSSTGKLAYVEYYENT